MNLDQIEPGETEDEMAGNIQALIDLLSESVLEMDLSFITGKGIVSGNIELIGQFLQIILELIMHMANEYVIFSTF